MVATSSLDSTVRVWDLRDLERPLHDIKAHRNEVLDIAFDYPGRRLATASSDYTAKVWDVCGELEMLATMTGHTDEISKVLPHNFNELVIKGRMMPSMSLAEMKPILAFMRFSYFQVCFSPPGGLLLTASADGTARIWLSDSGICSQVLSGHEQELFSCAFSYTGDVIITASKDNTCKIWR